MAGTPGTSPGAFEDPTFVAVDNSASPSSGDVYVVDSATNVISKFEANGTLVASWGAAGSFRVTAQNPSNRSSESLWTLPATCLCWRRGNPGHMFSFGENGELHRRKSKLLVAVLRTALASIQMATSSRSTANPAWRNSKLDGTDIGQVTISTTNAGLAVDSSNGDLFVVLTNGQINRYAFEPSGEVVGTGCTPAPAAGCPPTETISEGVLTEGGGLAVDSDTHTVYAADPATDQVIPFALVTTPDVITKPATAIGAESATLNGEINPNGVPLTACFFEWGVFEGPEDDTYGQTVPCVDPNFEEVGEGTEFEEVHADISELDPGTTYHFQLRAANASNAPGESIPGGNEDFLTLGPTIQNESATQVTATGARISGEISPNGKATSFVVQYVTEAQFQAQGTSPAQAKPPIRPPRSPPSPPAPVISPPPPAPATSPPPPAPAISPTARPSSPASPPRPAPSPSAR